MKDFKILNPGQRLKEIRRTLKLRQEELAGEKFSKNYISMFENNKRTINAINATYLSDRINELAKEKGINISITSSYFLKNEKDIANDKCVELIKEVEVGTSLTNEDVFVKLYKASTLSESYKLFSTRSKVLYLKGIRLMENKLHYCAITHFLKALSYATEENDFNNIAELYQIIGITLYKQKQLQHALIYFNLCDDIIKRMKISDDTKLEEVKYFKGLCYYEMGEYSLAKKIIGNDSSKNIKLLELASQLDKSIAG